MKVECWDLDEVREICQPLPAEGWIRMNLGRGKRLPFLRGEPVSWGRLAVAWSPRKERRSVMVSKAVEEACKIERHREKRENLARHPGRLSH